MNTKGIGFDEFLKNTIGTAIKTPEEIEYEKETEQLVDSMKGCPICGSKPEIHEERCSCGHDMWSEFRAFCPKCGITTFRKGHNEREAIKLWSSIGEK